MQFLQHPRVGDTAEPEPGLRSERLQHLYPRLASSSPFSESVSRKRSGCSGSSAIITIHPTTDTFLFDVDLN